MIIKLANNKGEATVDVEDHEVLSSYKWQSDEYKQSLTKSALARTKNTTEG